MKREISESGNGSIIGGKIRNEEENATYGTGYMGIEMERKGERIMTHTAS